MVKGKMLYMVWIDIDPAVEDEWNRWQRETHVPEVAEKGNFLSARRFVVTEGNAPGKYVNVYEAKDEETFKKYIEGPGKALREDYAKHYGKASKLTRIVVQELPV
jgi:hypothetical protein